jgi:hypothetical protein
LAEIDDDDARSAVAKLAVAHDIGVSDGDFEECVAHTLTKLHEGGMSMADDVEKNKRGKMDFREGISAGGSNIDMEPWREYEKIKDLFRQEPRVTDFTNNIFQGIIFSSSVPPTGRGKTNTMYTFVKMCQTVFPDLRVLSNNTSDPFETVDKRWDDIEKSIREYDGWQILLIDEAAQFLQYADQTSGKTVSQMLKLLRHNHCHLIMVGHTGRDIPADIRRQMFTIDKKSEKEAVVGYGITQQSGKDRMEVGDELMTLENIPATSVEYDDIDDEGIEIIFEGGESDDEDEEVVTCKACNATSEQYSVIKEDGFCPYHDPSDVEDSENDATDENIDDNPHPPQSDNSDSHENLDKDEFVDEIDADDEIIDELVEEIVDDLTEE